MIFNLSDQKNPAPFLALILQKITPEEFVTADLREFASQKMIKDREEATNRGLYNKRTDWDTEMVKAKGDKFKGMFKCESCDSDRTGFIQIQIERADEPMTLFVYCYDCHHRYCFVN